MSVTSSGTASFGPRHPRLVRGLNLADKVVQLASPFRVDKVTDSAGLEALRPKWNETLAASSSNCVFLTWEWLATWWKRFGSQGTLVVFVVRFGDEITAIAPFRIRPSSFRAAPGIPVLEFLGSGYVGSDYLDVIIRDGFEAESLNALVESFRISGNSFAFRWTNVRSGDCAAARLFDLLKKDRWTGEETLINVCPYIPLSGCTWNSYLDSLGAEHRYDFRRKHKRLSRDFRVEFVQAGPDTCTEFIDRLIDQHNARWAARGGSDAFHTKGLVAFHREVTGTMLNQGWLRLYTLQLDGKPSAFLYGFLHNGKFSFYQSSFDPAYEKYSVGTVIMGLTIQRALEEGASEFDLLHGNETYKHRWTQNEHHLARIELYPPGWRGNLSRQYVKAGRFALKVARRVLKDTPAQ